MTLDVLAKDEPLEYTPGKARATRCLTLCAFQRIEHASPL